MRSFDKQVITSQTVPKEQNDPVSGVKYHQEETQKISGYPLVVRLLAEKDISSSTSHQPDKEQCQRATSSDLDDRANTSKVYDSSYYEERSNDGAKLFGALGIPVAQEDLIKNALQPENQMGSLQNQAQIQDNQSKNRSLEQVLRHDYDKNLEFIQNSAQSSEKIQHSRSFEVVMTLNENQAVKSGNSKSLDLE